MFGLLTIDEGPPLSMTAGRAVAHFLLVWQQLELTSTTTQGWPEARLSFTSKMASVPPLAQNHLQWHRSPFDEVLNHHLNFFHLKQECNDGDAKTSWGRIHHLSNSSAKLSNTEIN